MWRWRRVAVARVFALVVRCRIMLLFVYSRVGKNRDTRRGAPAGAGAGRTADHLTVPLARRFSRCGAPMTYTDLLCVGWFYIIGFRRNRYSTLGFYSISFWPFIEIRGCFDFINRIFFPSFFPM